jgi:membrane-associated phospholipid phosphatase
LSQALFTLSSGNDLFFSGHAGYPFLLALIFWQYKRFRYLFLFCSIGGAVAVIFGHLHYSIDVFSAYFITFGVFEMAKRFFRKEFGYFQIAQQ